MAARLSSIEEGLERPPVCAAAPLLWSLLPLATGIALGNRAPLWLLWAAFAAGLIGLAFAFRRRSPLAAVSTISLLAGLILGTRASDHPHPGWATQPPREARVQLSIDDVFNARKAGRIAGIGTIIETNLPVDTISGRQAAFYLESGALRIPPAIGQELACRAVLTRLPWLKEVDAYERYLLRRDVFLSLNQGTVLELSKPAGRIEQLRQRLYQSSQELLRHGSLRPEDPGNVLASMLLGNRSLLTDERVELYRKTGTYHLFAVSGLHVGSVAVCLLYLCRLCRVKGSLRIWPILMATWGYVWLTGSSPSAVRAGIMISCVFGARSLVRQPHLFPALVLSAWLVLIIQPTQLFHLGFQLSYGVVASIVLVGLPLTREFRLWMNGRFGLAAGSVRIHHSLVKLASGTMDLACISLSAGLASMPLIIEHFQLFAPAGVILGVILNPLATACVMVGSIILLSAPIVGAGVAGWLALATWPIIHLMEVLLTGCLRIPGAVSSRSWPWPPSGTCLLLSMLLVAWALQRYRMRNATVPAITHVLPLAIILSGLCTTQVNT